MDREKLKNQVMQKYKKRNGKSRKVNEFREDKWERWNAVSNKHHAEAKLEKKLKNEKWCYANIRKYK